VRRVSKLHNFLIEIDPCREFLAPGAPCEINIDGKTMEKVHQEMKTPSRFTFDAAQEHVYTLLLKKDCYPRFIRSEYYKNLLATAYSLLRKSGKFSLKKN
jgi:regulator of G-protein signaling